MLLSVRIVVILAVIATNVDDVSGSHKMNHKSLFCA